MALFFAAAAAGASIAIIFFAISKEKSKLFQAHRVFSYILALVFVATVAVAIITAALVTRIPD